VPLYRGCTDFVPFAPHLSLVYRAMMLLVSPLLVTGTPATVLAVRAAGGRADKAALWRTSTINAIAFDKTGTLTIGKPEVTDLRPAEGVSEEGTAPRSAAVERRSQHPCGRCSTRRRVVLPEAGELQSVTARGVRSEVEEVVELGALAFGKAALRSAPSPPLPRSAGRTQHRVVRHGERAGRHRPRTSRAGRAVPINCAGWESNVS
jgi:Cd2+/Zn2+-exporting ATPase